MSALHLTSPRFLPMRICGPRINLSLPTYFLRDSPTNRSRSTHNSSTLATFATGDLRRLGADACSLQIKNLFAVPGNLPTALFNFRSDELQIHVPAPRSAIRTKREHFGKLRIVWTLANTRSAVPNRCHAIFVRQRNAKAQTKKSLRCQRLAWWAHQGSNLGPAD